MPPSKIDHLLIGGGIASASAARVLREQEASGSILLVGREQDPPYHRPPVSKGYLRGTESREQARVLPADWYAAHDVEVLTRTSVVALDLEARTAKLSTRQDVEFSTALVATGAMVRRLQVDGAALQGIHYLRALGNADAIRRESEQAENIVVVGGSYIACEVAASLTSLGRRCTMIMLEGSPLERGFGTQAGRFFGDVLEQHGVTVLDGEEVARFEGDGDGQDARVARVVTRSGRELPADLVVAGVGVVPDVMLARKAGLALGELGGVRADSRLQASVSGVFVAGDIAEYDSPVHGRVMRIEHEDVAAQQGATAALNMLGADRPHDVVPYFFSDLADWASLEYVGPAREWDAEVVRGSMADGRFSLWYLSAGRVMAALSVGRPDDIGHARRLIAGAATLGEAQRATLGDTDSDLTAWG